MIERTDSMERNVEPMDLASITNLIDQMAVRELMNDRYFFIPCYQRGYRWGKTQIYDLCNDLLNYALKKEQEAEKGNQNKSFYCLQPIIVIPKKFKINDQEHDGFEVVDGQQRLTSLYILYRFLMNKTLKADFTSDVSKNNDVVYKEFNTNLFHLFYETRPEDYAIIEKIGYMNLCDKDIRDIDIAHISNAYQYMVQWIDDDKEGALSLLKRFPNSKIKNTKVRGVINCLIDLLHAEKNSKSGSAQVIWYQLDPNKDSVKEFIKENTGKIRLTDTELIKGLFLQKRNWDKTVAPLQQISIGKDWELIENTLHRNDFWAFLSKDIHQEDNRINIVFEYLYQKHHGGEMLPKDPQNALFRFYSDYFEDNLGKAGGGMAVLWEEVKECFQDMQNWYNDPYLYNLIGLLTRQGMSLYDINRIFNLDEVKTREDFLWELKGKILENLEKPKDNPDSSVFPERYFALFKGAQDPKIKNLLLFVNVWQSCKKLDEAQKDIELKEKKSDKDRTEQDLLSHMYKFPYDVLESFKWDLEHVDSATTNQIQDIEEKKKWVEAAESSEILGTIIKGDQIYISLKEVFEKYGAEKTIDQMITRIKVIAQDDTEDDKKQKDWVGNLTLLDLHTNRSYGNALFVVKHNTIRERISEGVFVPICTQKVFEKDFPGCARDFRRWDWEDKKTHHKFLLDQYDEFERKIVEHKKSTTSIAVTNNQKIGEIGE